MEKFKTDLVNYRAQLTPAQVVQNNLDRKERKAKKMSIRKKRVRGEQVKLQTLNSQSCFVISVVSETYIGWAVRIIDLCDLVDTVLFVAMYLCRS